MTVEYTLDALAHADDMATKATELAENAIALYESLEEQGKDLLAVIMTRHAKEYALVDVTKKLSETQLERLARCDAEWKTFRDGLYEARIDMAFARSAMKNALRHWETIQSGLSYKREELRRAVA